jgi:hypothetical protein
MIKYMLIVFVLFSLYACSGKVYYAFDKSQINHNGIWYVTDTIHKYTSISRYVNRKPFGYECLFEQDGSVIYSFSKLGGLTMGPVIVIHPKDGSTRLISIHKRHSITEYHKYF